MDAGASSARMDSTNLNWMMVEPFIFSGDDADSFADAPFKAHGITTRGDSITVGLHIRRPPEISRLYLQWPGGPDPKEGSSCDLVAADGNLLLLRLTSSPPLLPLEKDESPPVCPQEHFICRASISSIKLERIPAPLFLKLNPVTAQGLFPPHTVGILCHGEDFIVAHLRLARPNPKEAELWVFRSTDSIWELYQQCSIQFKAQSEASDLTYWKTDKVLASKSCLYWVDYCTGGILSCELLEDKPTIRYLRIPIANRSPAYEVRHFQQKHRSLCITKEGLMFVDIASHSCTNVGSLPAYTAFTITCYAWKRTDSFGFDWVEVSSARSDELNLLKPLTYPLVNMDETNILYFLMPDKVLDGIDNISIVTIDMKSKKILSIDPYVNGVEYVNGKDSDMIKEKARMLHPFVPSEIPSWLPKSSSKLKKTTKTKSRRAKSRQYH